MDNIVNNRSYKSILPILLAGFLYLLFCGMNIYTVNAELNFEDGNGSYFYPYIIKNADQLQNLKNDYKGDYYKLGADIDVTNIEWEPIGISSFPFEGELDGNNHTITGLTINLADQDNVGMFAYLDGSIENIHFENVNIVGKDNVGTVGGYNGGSIANVTVKGSVNGEENVGGIVGLHRKGAITNVKSDVRIKGLNTVGGIVGESYSAIYNTSTSGKINGNRYIGGLVGRNLSSSQINGSSSSTEVNANVYVGGLVGKNEGSVKNSYATGNVNGSTVRSNTGQTGGLIGENKSNVTNVYSIGSVTAWYDNTTGGLIGKHDGNLNYSNWNKTSNDRMLGTNSKGTVSNTNEEGNSIEELKSRSYDNWDFVDTWYMYENVTLPFLQWENPFKTLDVSINKESLQIGDEVELMANAVHEEGEFDVIDTVDIQVNKDDVIEIVDGKVVATGFGEANIKVSLYDKEKILKIIVLPDAPFVDEPQKYTKLDMIEITGKARSGLTIEISGGSEIKSDLVNEDGSFSVKIPLKENQQNHLKVVSMIEEFSSEPKDLTVVHDNTAPKVPIININPENQYAETVTIEILHGQDEGSGVEVTKYRLNENMNWQVYSEPINISERGTYKVETYSIDKAGNKGDIATKEIVLSKRPPSSGGGSYIPSDDTSLKMMKLDLGLENFLEFVPNQHEYELETEEAEVEFSVEANNPKTIITINDVVLDGKQQFPLKEGENIFKLVVTAENGDKETYTITINRLKEVPFTDIDEHWAEDFIKDAYRNDWFKGYPDGTFGPEDSLGRMQIASLFVRILELERSKPVSFTDTKGLEEVTLEELKKAYAYDIIRGYEDNTFKPYNDVSRAHIALMIARVYAQITGSVYIPTGQAAFPDIAHYDEKTQNAILLLKELGIADGDQGEFKPDDTTTRAHAAKILVNFKEVLDNLVSGDDN